MKLSKSVEIVVKNKTFILESFISYFSAFWVQKLLMYFRSSLKLQFWPGRGGQTLLRETHWKKYLDNYIEVNKAGLWDLKWKCQSMALHQSVKQRHVNYSKSNNNEERAMHFLHSFHHFKNFSSRCFSSWWLLITSHWLHVWVASLCYLHPTFSS